MEKYIIPSEFSKIMLLNAIFEILNGSYCTCGMYSTIFTLNYPSNNISIRDYNFPTTGWN